MDGGLLARPRSRPLDRTRVIEQERVRDAAFDDEVTIVLVRGERPADGEVLPHADEGAGVDAEASLDVVVRREAALLRVEIERPRIVARTGTDNMPIADYTQPAMRATRAPAAEPVARVQPAAETQVDYLDIPAFLRRQAD